MKHNSVASVEQPEPSHDGWIAREIKIYGERNAGTNYLTELLKANLEARLLPGTVPMPINRAQRLLPGNQWLRDIYFSRTFHENLGWKHSMVIPPRLLAAGARERNVGFITITKNPYSWLLSMHRRPYNNWSIRKASFEDFLRTRWRTVGRENAASLANPIHLWNQKNGAYRELAKALPTLSIRYEDILADPNAVLEKTATFLRVQRKHGATRNVFESTKNDGDKDFSYYQSYYLQERWRDSLSMRAIGLINDRLDRSLMEYFGYAFLSLNNR
jgi:Sulfotransferase domain